MEIKNSEGVQYQYIANLMLHTKYSLANSNNNAYINYRIFCNMKYLYAKDCVS